MQIQLKHTFSLFSAAALIGLATPSLAQTTTATPTPTPAPIPVQPTPAPTSTVAQLVAQSTDHATLERLIQAAQFGTTLSQPGPITIFAPDDGAFSRLAPGTVDTLLKPANAKSLTDILKYHVIQGAVGVDALKKKITDAGGKTTLTTLQGQTVTASLEPSGALLLTDANGNQSYISKASEEASNGVVEYVNGVLTPKLGADGAAEAGSSASGTTPPSADGTTAPPTSGTTTPPAAAQGTSTGS